MRPAFGRFIGVDFSAAADAGRGIWIAAGTPRGTVLRIDLLVAARDLPGGGIARDAALAGLRAFLAAQRDALVGLDFPFGLPAPLVDAPDWRGFLADFTRRHPDAEAFRASCRARTGGRELRRRTDREARTPFCAYNLRLYRQTWWGIAAIVAPLVAAGAGAPPMLPAVPGTPNLAEICPASTLKALGLYPSYKGRATALADARAAILARIGTEGLEVPADIGATAVADPGGDALDALIAAFAAWRAALRPELFEARDALDLIEARVLL